MRAARDQLDLVDREDLETHATSLGRNHAGGDPNLHSHRSGLEMLDAQPSANRRLAGFEVVGDGTNRRRLEPMTEHGGGQHRHPALLEAVGAVLRQDGLLEDSLLAFSNRPHGSTLTGSPRRSGGAGKASLSPPPG